MPRNSPGKSMCQRPFPTRCVNNAALGLPPVDLHYPTALSSRFCTARCSYLPSRHAQRGKKRHILSHPTKTPLWGVVPQLLRTQNQTPRRTQRRMWARSGGSPCHLASGPVNCSLALFCLRVYKIACTSTFLEEGAILSQVASANDYDSTMLQFFSKQTDWQDREQYLSYFSALCCRVL